jgi:hypothetical protein
MNECKLEIFFRFVEIDGKYMGVKIRYNELESVLTPVDNSTYCYEQNIKLPCSVHLDFFGKDNSKDTKIDEQGNILKDKHTLIKAINLDNLPIESLYVKRKLELIHSNGATNSNYIGYNGAMVIQFEKSNVFAQVLHMKRLGEY